MDVLKDYQATKRSPFEAPESMSVVDARLRDHVDTVAHATATRQAFENGEVPGVTVLPSVVMCTNGVRQAVQASLNLRS